MLMATTKSDVNMVMILTTHKIASDGFSSSHVEFSRNTLKKFKPKFTPNTTANTKNVIR